MTIQQERIQDRVDLGERRIIKILSKHGIATMRMLEQKISDAGPNPQRVESPPANEIQNWASKQRCSENAPRRKGPVALSR